MLLLQALLGCTPTIPPAPQLATRPYLHVSLVARAEQNPAWTARISAHAQRTPTQDIVAGQCIPFTGESTQDPLPSASWASASWASASWASSVSLSLPENMPLTWDGTAWRTTGPLLGQDPAWVTADLGWYNGESHTSTGVVRFGEMPQIQSIERQKDGSVQLRWQNRTANKQLILTQSADTGIPLLCGTMRDGATLPAWAAPKDATILLKSTRTRISEQDQTLIIGDATIEQPIQLDAPLPEMVPVTPTHTEIPDTHRGIGLLKKKRDRKG